MKHIVLTGLARAKLRRHPSTNAIFSMAGVFVAVGWLAEDQVPKHTFKLTLEIEQGDSYLFAFTRSLCPLDECCVDLRD